MQENTCYTPSDFPLAEFSQSQLDGLLGELPKKQVIEAIYPLTSLQQGMLYHSLKSSDNSIYCNQLSFKIEGTLDVGLWQRAWQEVMDGQPTLRGSFHWRHGKAPCQVIHKTRTLNVDQLNWEQETELPHEQQLDALLSQDLKKGFVLDRAPLIRGYLIKLSSQAYYFVISQHHIILDGWSTPLLFEQVISTYHRLLTNQSELGHSPFNYQHYVTWLKGQDKKKTTAYWKTLLKDYDTDSTLDMHLVDLEEKACQSESNELDRRLSSSMSKRINDFAKRSGVTPSTLFQGVWAITLSHLYCSEDIIYGVTDSGRDISVPHIEEAIGLFINTFPVRLRLRNTLPIKEYLVGIQNQIQDSKPHAHVNIAELKQYTALSGISSLFETIFVYENYPISDAYSDILDFSISDINGREEPDYPLLLSIKPSERYEIVLSWNNKTASKRFYERLMDFYLSALTSILKNDNVSVGNISCLSEKDEKTLLNQWSQSPTQYTPRFCIHELFESQVTAHPDNEALVFHGQSLSYKELNTRANQYARHLKIKTGDLVAICMERRLEMVVCLLAVLKKGGAYIPLDIVNPPERLQKILSESKPRLLVCQDEYELFFNDYNGSKLLLSDLDKNSQGLSGSNLNVSLDPQDLAYVIYTSGTTGKPKGVLCSHQGLVDRILWRKQLYKTSDQSRILHASSFSFDASVLSFFWPLGLGSTLVMTDEQQYRDTTLLADLILENGITDFDITPLLLDMLLDVPKLKEAKSIKYVLSGGDVLSPKTTRKFFDTLNAKLHNTYGPTEAAVDSLYYEVCPSLPYSSIPLGKPIGHVKAYILDKHLKPVPIGLTGELYLGGVGLSAGYLNNAELTEQKFVLNPFDKGQSHIYKTGDLARWMDDGNIKFNGRVDHQLKIRGYRIEPGEIESHLLTHVDVKDCVVDAFKHLDTSYLVAYIVSDFFKNDVNIKQKLRPFLKERLPEYMVPQFYIPLESLPTNNIGKIDRKALPMPILQQKGHVDTKSLSTNEKCLIKVWKELLKVKTIDPASNFFDLGGHSLLVTQLISRVRNEFNIDISITEFLQNPTVKDLSGLINSGSPLKHDAVVTLQSGQSKPPIYFIHTIAGNVLCYNEIVKHLDKEQAVFGIQQPYSSTKKITIQSLERIAKHYTDIIKVSNNGEPCILAGWCFSGVVATEIARQLDQSGNPETKLILIESRPPSKIHIQDMYFDEASELAHLAKDIALNQGKAIEFNIDELQGMKRKSRIGFILDVLKEQGIVSDQFSVNEFEDLYKIAKANYQSLSSHRVKPFNNHGLIIRSTETFDASSEDETLGWSKYNSSKMLTAAIETDHYGIIYEDHARAVAHLITDYLTHFTLPRSRS